MENITVKEAKEINYNRVGWFYNSYTSKFWYDWFSNRDTLGGKLRKHVLPFIKKIPGKYDNYFVWCKESVPMWCNGFVYNVFVCRTADEPSRIRMSRSETGIDLYVYDYENPDDILFKKHYDNFRCMNDLCAILEDYDNE